MNPGRELDALIAKKVMGETDSIESLKVWVPKYSVSIDAAWEVVEKGLVESVVKLSDGRWFARPAQSWYDWDLDKEVLKCGYNMGGVDGGYYEIPIYEKDTFGAIATSAPHAICLAALKAIAP